MAPEAPVARATGVSRSYLAGRHSVPALQDVSMTVERGEVVAIMGPSGSGKSTLLFLLAGLDRPDSGTVEVGGTTGFIPQGLSLLPQATAAENVEVPLLLDGAEPAARAARVAAALERVGLTDHAVKLPDQLSGGEQQRIAIARALVTDPVLVLADEPTGSLDSETGQAVTRLLLDAAGEGGAAVLVVTHDPAVAAQADRVLSLHSGRMEPA